MKLENYKRAIKDCSKAIELDDKYLKAYFRRAQSYEATEKYDECLADFKKILELDPAHKEAQAAVIRLPPLIEEKNEKLKKEMLGKLKDLGNMILKPFGLSTDNFQMEQDPESKGYKINFKQ
ncbi:Tetratricopeptide repeat protein 1 [Papilio machaon]|uniref:Tetratricopeptide repeat protein 1 n=1 Tax=Papilio machaon TaxID=76193 RepID=A0A0N1IF89_PAPMA|nr:Tetratricopeptide repeat protein 1 [Papilio machaon]